MTMIAYIEAITECMASKLHMPSDTHGLTDWKTTLGATNPFL